MKNILIIVLACSSIFLSGCAASYQSQDTMNLVLTRCPNLKVYSPERGKRMVAEMKNLPDDSELIEIMGDYQRLRDACRIAERRVKNTK